jgi:DNA-binding NarL/FixJ family response regulator
MKTVRILVADDHKVMRDGLRRLLETQQGWEVCGEAETGHEAVARARQLKPDIILVDFRMPELNGAEVTRQILQESPCSQVLMFSLHNSLQVVREALEAGVRGYILKSEAGRDLVSAVRSLIEHKLFLSPSIPGEALRKFWKDHRAEIQGQGVSGRGES